MQVTFKYMAQLKQAAGVEEETIETEATASLVSLANRLADRHDDSFRRIVLDASGKLQPSILFFVGDQQVQAQEPYEFRDGDVITVMSPMAGG